LNINVLFVCLGNICRSPSAQSVLEAQIKKLNLDKVILVDSCGTAGYHIGEAPDPRSITAAENRGYKMSHLRGRKFSINDFEAFDYILAMDQDNLSNILALAPSEVNCHISLFLKFNPKSSISEVPDPYYGGTDGFDEVLDLIESACEGLLSHIQNTDLK